MIVAFNWCILATNQEVKLFICTTQVKRKYVARDVILDEGTKWKWATAQNETQVFGQDWTRFPSEIPYEDVAENNDPAQDQGVQHEERGPESPSPSSGPSNPTNSPQTPTSVTNDESNSSPKSTTLSSDSLPNRSTYDDTLVRGFRTLEDVLSRCQPFDDEFEELMFAGEEPKTYVEAANEQEWQATMKKELESIEANNTWILTNLPKGQKPIGLKWVYKVKKDAGGKIIKHKARLVAKGYVQ